jgi:hypothetical protein
MASLVSAAFRVLLRSIFRIGRVLLSSTGVEAFLVALFVSTASRFSPFAKFGILRVALFVALGIV